MSEDEPLRFRSRSFDVGLYTPGPGDEPGNELAEGRTTSISRAGMGIRGNLTAGWEPVEVHDWEGRSVTVKFYTSNRSLNSAQGTITMVGESDERRYRWYFGIEFDDELELSKLQAQ